MYSPEEIRDILRKLNSQADEIKFEPFEKLGLKNPVNLHLNNVINYICEICKKSLLSNHLLDLHVSENHDTFFEIQSTKKPSFKCLLEACQCVSNTPEERKDHCIREHHFCHDFPFENSRPKKADTDKEKTSPVAKHKNFHFGHKSQKTFKSSGQTKIDMKELMDVLPDV